MESKKDNEQGSTFEEKRWMQDIDMKLVGEEWGTETKGNKKVKERDREKRRNQYVGVNSDLW